MPGFILLATCDEAQFFLAVEVGERKSPVQLLPEHWLFHSWQGNKGRASRLSACA